MTDYEITRALAEKVMGWELGALAGWPDTYADEHLLTYSERGWNPLENIEQAFQVVDAISGNGFKFRIVQTENGDHIAWFEKYDGQQLSLKTDPGICGPTPAGRCRAICLAALFFVEDGEDG